MAAFLKESPWMAPNLQHFDPAKFNIAVHVRLLADKTRIKYFKYTFFSE